MEGGLESPAQPPWLLAKGAFYSDSLSRKAGARPRLGQNPPTAQGSEPFAANWFQIRRRSRQELFGRLAEGRLC